MLGLYIHIPFCNNLCYYCDFAKLIKQKEETKISYIDKLIDDLDKLKGYHFDTLYIGGGTPNYLSNQLLDSLLNKIDELNIDIKAERTIECNFELINEEQIKILKKHNINRLSIGVQTFDYEVGSKLNRYSDYELLSEKMELIREYGFSNVNFDLIYALPNQTLDIIKSDLDKALSLKPQHISYYSLIYEENCVLDKINVAKIDEDLELEMFSFIKDKLSSLGYKRYEISNFAFNGYESKHNLLYWNLDEYIGVGLSASSLIDGKRITNSRKLKDYMANLGVETLETSKEEYFILGLRKTEGVSLSYFNNKYGVDAIKEYNLDKYLESGLLILDGDYLRFSDKGFDLSNQVLINFV